MRRRRSLWVAMGWMACAVFAASCGDSEKAPALSPGTIDQDASLGGSAGTGFGGTGAQAGQAGTGGSAEGGTGGISGSGGDGGDGGGGDGGDGGGGDGGDGGPDDGGDAGDAGGQGGTGGDSGVILTCHAFGESCTGSADCCSLLCDPDSSTCLRTPLVCTPAGGPCVDNTECCTTNCSAGACSAEACIGDGQACAAGGAACCSGSCEAGTCKDINGGNTCKSSGNACAANGECCSKLCDGGFCQLGVSQCIQMYDLCTDNLQCCGGRCLKTSASDDYGYCAPLDVGPARCKDGAAGMVCVNSAGEPSCGMCCSRACAPGPKGVFVCQAPSGCRPSGELCTTATECCGGDTQAGLPGSVESVVVCDKTSPNDEFGRCKSTGCTPQGDVCQLFGGACAESTALPSNCCPTNANPSNPAWKKGECAFDSLLIPRCDGLADCVPQGGYCSSSSDCCNDLPCIPDPDDNDRLKCYIPADGGGTCVPSGGTCTADADCCPGSDCIIPPGEVFGTCGNQGTGGSGGGPIDAGPGGSGGSGECSTYGQTCGVSDDCCNTDLGVTCIGGRCLIQG